MSEEFGLTNSGDGIVPVPVEKKEPTLVKRERTALEKEVDAELIAKGPNNPDFLAGDALTVYPKKKRGRPAKQHVGVESTVEVKPQWRCSTCQEHIDDKNVMKIGAGDNRWAVFCPYCQKSLGFQDDVLHKTIAKLIKDNPTGKSEKV
ncbi:MAG: hypothetical protein ACREBR_04465 [bacterium]